MSSTTHQTKTRAPAKWTRAGSARVRGSGLWIETADGRTFGIGAEDLAAFIFDGAPAAVLEIDPAGIAEPVPVGHMDLSQSGRMVLVMIDGEPFTGRQMPAAALLKHYRTADRAPVAVMAPPTPSSLAVPA